MAWYWAAWLILGFGLPEGIALGTGHGEWTLSETAWNWFDVTPGSTIRQWSIVHFLLALGMTWLWVHMVLRAWTVWRTHK